MAQRTIALLTDFGLRDPYVGVMKGVILRINPGAAIVDLSHFVEPQDILQAAFYLANSYRFFAPGTIFISVVDPGVGSSRRALVVKAGDYVFISPDNGLLTLVLQQFKRYEAYEIAYPEYLLSPRSHTFHGRDVFAPAAAHIAAGVPFEKLGPSITASEDAQPIHLLDIPPVEWVKEEEPEDKKKPAKKLLRGPVIFADHFGNLVTSISAEMITPWGSPMSFTCSETGECKAGTANPNISKIRIGSHDISRINNSYSESKPGELLAIIGSFDTLEISVNNGSAKDLLGKNWKTTVEVEF